MDNHFLYFSRAERNGVIVLVLLCAALLAAPALLPERTAEPTTDFSALEAEIAALEAASGGDAETVSTPDVSSAAVPAAFAPNTATEDELRAAGVSARGTRAWLNYVRKGGRFRNWQDVERFRALTSAERERLRPYVRFEESTPAVVKTEDAFPPALNEAFDPNTVDRAALEAMGLSRKVADNWTRFLAAGGRFRRAEDITRIYGITEADLDRLLPLVRLASPAERDDPSLDGLPPEATPRATAAAAPEPIIDVNAATAEEWQALRGIGPAYSRRIVNFRDKLGGFHAVAQVGETYGLPDSVFQKILPRLRSSPVTRRLPVNTATVEELAAHPYLRFDDARLLVRYRDEHGPYRSAADLDKLYGLSEETKTKIRPYLSF